MNDLRIFLEQVLTDLEAKMMNKKEKEMLIKLIKSGLNKLKLYIDGKQPGIDMLKSIRYLSPNYLRRIIENKIYNRNSIINFIFSSIRSFELDFYKLEPQFNLFFNLISDEQSNSSIFKKNDIDFWLDIRETIPDLADLVIGLISIPITSADAERSFSYLTYILGR